MAMRDWRQSTDWEEMREIQLRGLDTDHIPFRLHATDLMKLAFRWLQLAGVSYMQQQMNGRK